VLGGLVDAINLIPGVNLAKPQLPKGFRGGGFTPNVGVNTVAGVVHGREFVTRAESTAKLRRRHPGLLEHMNRYGEIPGYRRGGWVHPMPGAVVTEEYGGYPGHRGIDLAMPHGTKIRSAGAGVVNFSGWYGGGGWMAGVDHGGGFVTRYKHMMQRPSVTLGQPVAPGALLGFEGSTGDSTGPHLHWEVIRNGERINPRPYLDGAADPGLFDIFGGLQTMLLGKLENAFPGSSVWVRAAAGLAGQGVERAIKWATDLLPFGGGVVPSLYDNGGWLDPGLHLVENRSGRPEPVLTAPQWDQLLAGRSGGIEAGARLALVLEDGTEFGAYVDDRAGGVVRSAFGSSSSGALASRLGGRRR